MTRPARLRRTIRAAFYAPILAAGIAMIAYGIATF